MTTLHQGPRIAPAPLLCLPPELLHRIFDEVKTLGGFASIQACSLVHSNFLPYTRPRLVAGSTLRLTSFDECIRALRLARFAPLVYEHFDTLAIWDKLVEDAGLGADPVLDEDEEMRLLGRKVADLQVETAGDTSYMLWQELGCLEELLMPLTRVKTLTVEWMPPDSDIMATSNARDEIVRILGAVETLTIGRSEFADPGTLLAFIRLSPSLRSLTCQRIAVGSPENGLPPPLPFGLSHVALTSVVHTKALFRWFTQILDPETLETLTFNYDPLLDVTLSSYISHLRPKKIGIVMPEAEDNNFNLFSLYGPAVAGVCTHAPSLETLYFECRTYITAPDIKRVVSAAASRTLRVFKLLLWLMGRADDLIALIDTMATAVADTSRPLECICVDARGSRSMADTRGLCELLPTLADELSTTQVEGSRPAFYTAVKSYSMRRPATTDEGREQPRAPIVVVIEIEVNPDTDASPLWRDALQKITVCRSKNGRVDEYTELLNSRCAQQEQKPSIWESYGTLGALLPGHVLLRTMAMPALHDVSDTDSEDDH